MRKILILGENSYIGNALKEWLFKDVDKYAVDSISVRDSQWKKVDFSSYDTLYHVAGLAHTRESKKNQSIYYVVNRDLTYNIAKKAKKDGVKQFIFLSTMSVYGLEKGMIDKKTELRPKSAYGKSKLEAENAIRRLEDKTFIITIIRPPMVYGKDCKGNYPILAKFALKTIIFPSIENQRSMIYIDNLSEFVKKIIDNRSSGIYFPQNKEYVNTSRLVKLVAEIHGKKVIMTKVFNPFLKLINIKIVNKVFGSLTYDINLSTYVNDYIVVDFINSIKASEEQ